MSNKLYFLAVILFLLTAGQAIGQKIWTLEECIGHAMSHNLQIRQAENTLRISDQNLFQSKAAMLPSINGTATHNYNFGRNIDPFTNQFNTDRVQSNNYTLGGSLILFNGFQIRNTIDQNRYDYMASEYQLATLKNDISLNIAAAYLDILFNKELVQNSTTQLDLSREQYLRTEKLVEAGTISPVMLYDLKSQIAFEEAQYTQRQNNLTLSYLNLSQLLDLASTDSFEIARPLMTISDSTYLPEPEEIIKTAFEQQPQIKVYEYRKLSAMELWKVNRGRLSPRLTLNASMSTLYSSSAKRLTGYEITGSQLIGVTQNSLDSVYAPQITTLTDVKPYGVQMRDNYNRFAGLTLVIPILNGWQVRGSINRAKLAAENADLDLQISRRNMEKNIRKAHTDARTAFSNYKAYQNSVKASEEALRNANKRFDVGLINSFELSQSKTTLSRNQSDLLRSKYDYIFKLKMLDYYRGIPLKL